MKASELRAAFREGAEAVEQDVPNTLSAIWNIVADDFRKGFTVLNKANVLQITVENSADDQPSIRVKPNGDGTYKVNHNNRALSNSYSQAETVRLLGCFHEQNAPKMSL
jgi:hypothetical protein